VTEGTGQPGPMDEMSQSRPTVETGQSEPKVETRWLGRQTRKANPIDGRNEHAQAHNRDGPS